MRSNPPTPPQETTPASRGVLPFETDVWPEAVLEGASQGKGLGQAQPAAGPFLSSSPGARVVSGNYSPVGRAPKSRFTPGVKSEPPRTSIPRQREETGLASPSQINRARGAPSSPTPAVQSLAVSSSSLLGVFLEVKPAGWVSPSPAKLRICRPPFKSGPVQNLVLFRSQKAKKKMG